MNLRLPLEPIIIDELVINWHITEACNYACRYCFAKWGGGQISEVWRDHAATSRLLKDLYAFFARDRASNPLWRRLRWHAVRLSIAGGEPTLLGERLIEVAQEARELGFAISLISNGSRLDCKFIERLAPTLSVLGLSLDAIDPLTNARIGRACRGRSLELPEMAAMAAQGRAVNPLLSVKVNTVVNAANAAADLSALIRAARPARWKVMRMLPLLTDELSVTPEAFAAFIERHAEFADILRPEGNEEMTDSYVMVDPHGRFFQNQAAGGYRFSAAMADVGPAAAFAEATFSPTRFAGRYSSAGAPTP